MPIFLLAFLIAVVVKFTVHEDEQPANRVIDAQVTYNLPPGDDLVIGAVPLAGVDAMPGAYGLMVPIGPAGMRPVIETGGIWAVPS